MKELHRARVVAIGSEEDMAAVCRTLLANCDWLEIPDDRPPYSLEELRRFGVTAPEMTLASDPALRLSPASDAEVDALLRESGADPGGRYVCFALRRWPGFNEKAEAFARAVRWHVERRVVLRGRRTIVFD